jgi:SAM-dependent methyltransferase
VKSAACRRCAIAAGILLLLLLAVASLLPYLRPAVDLADGESGPQHSPLRPVDAPGGRSRGADAGGGGAAQLASTDDVPRIAGWRVVEDLPRDIALFETVFWEPRDTTTLRRLLREQPLVREKTVLEIGTGSGLIALCCLQAGARRVVATDINPAAVANAAYNADHLGFADRLEVRRVSPDRSGAYDVLNPAERFDLIISNPPWEDSTPVSVDQFALYDDRFRLLRSILHGLPKHLEPGGTAYLAYGSVSSVRLVLQLAAESGFTAQVLDDRDLDQLPEVFLPAMVIQVTPPADQADAATTGDTSTDGAVSAGEQTSHHAGHDVHDLAVCTGARYDGGYFRRASGWPYLWC